MLTTTETLLNGLAEGNESRWARFYRDYAPFLESVVLKKYPSMSHADAEEIVSEAMINIAKMMPTYQYDREKKGAFHSLLAKIAQNSPRSAFRFRFVKPKSQGGFDDYVGPNINTIMLASVLCWLQKYFREFPKEFATSLLTKPT